MIESHYHLHMNIMYIYEKNYNFHDKTNQKADY